VDPSFKFRGVLVCVLVGALITISPKIWRSTYRFLLQTTTSGVHKKMRHRSEFEF
jgi:hypothetical protein